MPTLAAGPGRWGLPERGTCRACANSSQSLRQRRPRFNDGLNRFDGQFVSPPDRRPTAGFARGAGGTRLLGPLRRSDRPSAYKQPRIRHQSLVPKWMRLMVRIASLSASFRWNEAREKTEGRSAGGNTQATADRSSERPSSLRRSTGVNQAADACLHPWWLADQNAVGGACQGQLASPRAGCRTFSDRRGVAGTVE